MNKPSSPSFSWVYAVVLVLALVVTGLGIRVAMEQQSWALLAAGAGSVIGVLIVWPLAVQLRAFHQYNCDHSERTLSNITDRFEQFSVMLNLISEQQLLSDRAKSVAFREKDSDALRRAIQEEMLKQNWEGALSLANEMEAQFGYKKEADQLRTEINQKHSETIRRQIADGSSTVERYCRAEAWPDAFREAQRIAQLFPDNATAQGLPQEVENRRLAQKQQLIDSWNDAVKRHDVDGSIEILKRLDAYLTPAEAEGFQETARGVFKEKINILRTQFSVAVQDHNWNEALRLADTITRDFPNSQMAREVREMMDTLRARASGIEPQPAEV